MHADAGVAVAYDPNLRLKLWPPPRGLTIIRATMVLAVFFLPSLDDLKTLSGLNDPSALLHWCHREGARTVVLKLGREGAWVSADGSRTQSAAHAVL